MVKVLFIDDDPPAHVILRLVLPEPCLLLSAYTARQGVETAAHEGPDVVLLDVNLPDMDGLRALRPDRGAPARPAGRHADGINNRTAFLRRVLWRFSFLNNPTAGIQLGRRCPCTAGCTYW